MLTAEMYIGVTRARVSVLLADAPGAPEIPASEVPALLNTQSNGKFKMKWAPYLISRVHIMFEKLDNEGKFNEMDRMLRDDRQRAKFLRWHMNMTDEIWSWRFLHQ